MTFALTRHVSPPADGPDMLVEAGRPLGVFSAAPYRSPADLWVDACRSKHSRLRAGKAVSKRRMDYGQLGLSPRRVSTISFGAGPVSGLMTGDRHDDQIRVIRYAVQKGINWFDTAATYGEGSSERNLGRALRDVPRADRIQVATKVRLQPPQLDDIPNAVRHSVTQSLKRLGMERVTMVQLHNSITARRGDLPTSITPKDVLGPCGVVAALEALRDEHRVRLLGLTGLGEAASLTSVIRDGPWQAIQIPYNVLMPLSADDRSAGSLDVDYLRLLDLCADRQLGVIAIRVFAGGALAGQQPSVHTRRTRFFPLDLFHRDIERANMLGNRLPRGLTVREVAVRFALSHPAICTALIGMGSEREIDEALKYAAAGPLEDDVGRLIDELAKQFNEERM